MNTTRHFLLSAAFGARATEVSRSLQVAATAAGVTVDDVVQAGLGRGGPGAEPSRVFLELEPDFFTPLLAWPYVCASCGLDVAALIPCFECKEPVCEACTGRYGCPDCTAKQAARITSRRLGTAESEATRKWLSRNMAEVVEEPEVEDVPAYPPEPGPDPVEPSDPVSPAWKLNPLLVSPSDTSEPVAEAPTSGVQ